MGTGLVRAVEDVSAHWLTSVLRDAGAAPQDAAVAEFEAEAIGTGQMSQSYRFRLAWAGVKAGPAGVLLRVPAPDETSRSTGINLGIYEREIRFYSEVAPRVGGPVARC